MFQATPKASRRGRLARLRIGFAIVVLALAGAAALRSAQAQAPVSAQPQNDQTSRPDLRGVWVSTNTALEDPRWTVDDRICSRCALPALKHLRAVLKDADSINRPLTQIRDEVAAFNAKYVTELLTTSASKFKADFDAAKDDPVLACVPIGVLRQYEGILPLRIEQSADKVVFRYEYWGAVRTIYMDGRGHPPNREPSALGHSIGWYDGDTLVIDTAGIAPNLMGTFITPGIRTSSQAQGIERYTRSKDGQSLNLEMTIVDPQTFRRPLILQKTFLYAPKEELQPFECSIEPEYQKKLSTRR